MRPKIIVYNQSFEVFVKDHVSRQTMLDVVENLKTYTVARDPRSKRLIRKVNGFYYYVSIDKNHFRLNYSSLKDVLRLLMYRLNLKLSELDIEDHRAYDTPTVHIKRNKKYKPKDYQHRYIDTITIDYKRSHLVDLIMGYGKTFIGTTSCLRLNKKFAILVRPTYIKKWISDIKEYTHVGKDEYYVIIGKKSIEDLMKMPKKQRDKIKIYIFSMRTMQLYIKSYLEESTSVPIPPELITKELGIHTVMNDESHQEFNALFNIMLYLDCKRLIGLSATMKSHDPAMNYMYQLLFPKADRARAMVDYTKYIQGYRVEYYLFNNNIRCEGPMGYNHIMYEQSLMRNQKVLYGYLEMILSYIVEFHLTAAKEGQKALIFFSTIDLCTIATNYFKRRLLDYDVRRYVEDDPYDDLIEGDIIISTNLSAGTGVDIPGLLNVYQTVSIGSLQANLQAPGRLREIKGSDTKYFYFYNPHIKKHVSLLHQREKALEEIVATTKHITYRQALGK